MTKHHERSHLTAQPDTYEQRLKAAAWSGDIAEGLLCQDYHAWRASAGLVRAADEVLQGDLLTRLAEIEAELEALIFQPPEPIPAPPPPPTPKVLHRVSRANPFINGADHHV